MRHPPVALPLDPSWKEEHYGELRCDAKTASREADPLAPGRLEAIQRGGLVLLQGTCCYMNQKEEFLSFGLARHGQLNEPPLCPTQPCITELPFHMRPSETYASLAAFGDTVYPPAYDKEQMDLNRRNYISEKIEVAQSTGSVKAIHIDCCDRVFVDGRVAIDLSMSHHVKHRKLILPERPPIYLRMAASAAFDKNVARCTPYSYWTQVFLCGFVDVEQEGNFEPVLLCTLDGFADPATQEQSHRRSSVSGFDDETAAKLSNTCFKSLALPIGDPANPRGTDSCDVAWCEGSWKKAGWFRLQSHLLKLANPSVYATCCTEEEYGIVHVVIDDDGCVWMRTDERPGCGRRLWLPALPFTRDVHKGDSCQKVLSLCSGFKHRNDEYGLATATRSGGVVVIEGCIGNTRDYADISTRHAALPIKVASLPSGFRPARVVRFLTASDILGNACKIELHPDGSVFWAMGHAHCWIHLTGIMFEPHG